MLGVTLPLGSFVVGAAAYAPFGGEVRFDRSERFASSMYPGAADGVARWHVISAQTRSIYATLGAAYRWGPLSFGLSGNLIFSSLELLRAQSLRGDNDLTREGRSHLDVSGVNGSFGAGLMVEALPERLWLSASYQAQPGLGVMNLNGSVQLDSTVPKSEDSLVQDVTLHQVLPDIWRIGARFRPTPNSELRVAADWTRWSALRTQCIALRNTGCQVTANGDAAPGSGTVQNIRRYWSDTLGARLGGSYWLSPATELFAGLGYETAASPDTTLDPLLADANNVALAAGARLELVHTWFVAASYTHLQFLPRDNTGKSALADAEVAGTTRRPDGGGRYSQWVGILNANLLKTF
jgi:long-chain fatty acid transport protein